MGKSKLKKKLDKTAAKGKGLKFTDILKTKYIQKAFFKQINTCLIRGYSSRVAF